MITNKKGAVNELGIILFGVIFMTLLNVSLGFITDTIIDEENVVQSVNDYIDELDVGFFSAAILTVLLSIANVFFGLFGVNFIGAISILPLWTIGLFSLLNALVVFAIIMYFVDRIWVG